MPPPSRSLLYRAQHAAAEALELFARAARPVATSASMPFTGAQQGQGNAPPPDYNADQPSPAASPLEYRGGYHDRTYRAPGQPIGIGGFTVSRMRGAIELHDTGASFLETSLFASAATRFAPVHAALAQCIAPVMDLPRYIRGGSKGLARLVREEVEAQLCPEAGAYSSPYFPTTLWGALAVEISMMNFAVLQHVLGDPDPETGVRPVYSRRFPGYAVNCDMWRKTYRANTTEGPFDILGDGKFTLLADEELPHLNSPIRALGQPVLSGVLANQARDQYINLYGNPKPIATMPEKVGVRSPEGDLFFRSVDDFRNPGGIIQLPNGAELTFAQLEGRTSTVFVDADNQVWNFIAAVLLGSEGTMTLGSGGVYTSPVFAKVARSISGRRLRMIVRGINDGHVGPFVDFNYAAGRTASKRAGTWTQPVLDIPLPDPDKQTRIDAAAKNMKAYTDQLVADRVAGIIVDEDRAKYVSGELEVNPGVLAEGKPTGVQSFAYDQENGVITINQRLEELGKPIDETGRGAMTIPAYRAFLAAKQAETATKDKAPTAPTDSQPTAPAEETHAP